MKQKIFIALVACVLLAACQKENIETVIPEGAIMLTTEGYSENGTKTSVQDFSVQWENNDRVRVNNYYYFVNVSDGKAYIDAPDITAPIYGYFGWKSGSGWTTTTPTIGVPSQYTTRMSGGRQKIDLPMVAYSATLEDAIQFKHITAAVRVMLKNSTGSTLYVDEVVVKTSTHRINGNATLDLTDADLGMAAYYTSSSEADRKVKVCFGEPIAIAAGNSDHSVQVPILPISGDALTIEVKCHTATTNLNYSKTLSEASQLVTLARNEMLTARLDINPANATTTERTVVDLSTVSGSSYTVYDGQVLTGTLANCTKIIIAAGATVTLKDASINANGAWNVDGRGSGLNCDGDATIIVEGTNTIHYLDEYKGGIYIPENYTLVIQGSGTLNAIGYYGAGIGGVDNRHGGNVIIAGGTVNASSRLGAGIGCGAEKSCGNITITGGTVTATSLQGAGIGTSTYSGTCGTVTITGGNVTTTGPSGIGTGLNWGTCGDIVITGGTVNATGTNSTGSGIGCGVNSGDKGTCGNITILSSVTSVTATKGASAPYSIGATNCGTVTIGGVTGAITTSPYTYPPAS
jgi:hypothetical protein